MLGILACGAPLLCGAQRLLPEAPSAVLHLGEPQAAAVPAHPVGSQTDLSGPLLLNFAESQPDGAESYGAVEKSLYPALIAPHEAGTARDLLAQQDHKTLPPCTSHKPVGSPPAGAPVAAENNRNQPCLEQNPLQPIVGTKQLPALTSRQKGYLAFRDIVDPFNLITVIGYAGIDIAINSHTAYGPGFGGFGRLTGYSLVEDAQGEFVGTFLIPSIVHEDPRYFRMPGRSFPRRLLHAVSHTIISQHDDGTPMPNYATLLTYPISAELTNLYVPGVQTDGPSTAKRIGLGLATDPAGQIVAEFLPDLARRIHIRVIFVQQILQQVAQGGTGGAVATP